jgi:hypothetical protein
MNGILLVDIDLTVKATRAGAYTGALQLIRSSTSLWPTWRAPFYQFNNFNGASNSAGAMSVDQVLTLGVWAWADRYDLFNTAALNGQQVSTAVRGMLVRNHGSPAVASDTPTCSISTTSSPRPAAVAVDAVRRACVVTVNAVNTVPAKQLAVTLTIPDVTGDQSAQVRVKLKMLLAWRCCQITQNEVVLPDESGCTCDQHTVQHKYVLVELKPNCCS